MSHTTKTVSTSSNTVTTHTATTSYSSSSGHPAKVTTTTTTSTYHSGSKAPSTSSTVSTTNTSSKPASSGIGGFASGLFSSIFGQSKPSTSTSTSHTSTSTTGTASTQNPRPITAETHATTTKQVVTKNGGTTSQSGTSTTTTKPSPVPVQQSTNIENTLEEHKEEGHAHSHLHGHGDVIINGYFSKISLKVSYDDLVEQLKESGKKFTDPDFPPQLNSLTGGLSDHELVAAGNPLNWKSLIWLRADEIYGKGKYQVFQDSIEPNDINQGALGDCYFLSTLASLAEFPDRIRRLFVSDQPNEQGCYAIKICDTGMWQTVIVDDFLPCSPKLKKPCFTKGNGNEIWVQLLEKAWAKVYGSYAKIEAGLTRECLHDLTGGPTKYYLTSDPSKYEEIWHAISHGEKKSYAMTCGASDFFEGADLMSSVGIVGSHAYSLLAAVTITDRDGKEVRLLKLRNPWGRGEWTGDWSDESSTWTEELKTQVQLEDKDDGIFFMSFPDFLKYFSDVQICKIHDNYVYHSLRAICDSEHACFFKLIVKEHGHYFITVNQESKRKHPEKDNYQYSEVYLVMGRKVENGYEYVEGYQRADKEVWTDGHLDAGEYIVYAKIAWHNHKPKEFSISSYGIGEVEIEQVPKSYCPDFIDKVYLSKGRQAKKFDDYKHCGVANCYRTVELTDDGFGYVYYRNESKKTLQEELNFKFFDGLKLKKPFRGNGFKISVPPGEERIIVTKVIPGATKIRQGFSEKARFI